MTGRPEVLFRHRSGPKKVSLILLDWNARESFHSIEYLNQQTAPRDSYELIWIEFYDRKVEKLRRMVESAGRPKLDQWLVLGYPQDTIYHKHRAYNAGLAAATGELCVICDSDAMFRPTFIESIIGAFEDPQTVAVHLDQVRNFDKKFYPFNYPSFEEVLGQGAVNWLGKTTIGLSSEEDRLHRANYGACLAAKRADLLAIGGADEHIDYLGYCCGPYDLTFRLLNRGGKERWLDHEFLYHTWHPNQTSINTDYSGPHDGRFLSLPALHARATGQVRPLLENPCLGIENEEERFQAFLRYVAEHPEPAWQAASPPPPSDLVYCVEKNYRGFDLFVHRNGWFACPEGQGFEAGRSTTLRARNEMTIRGLVISELPRKSRPILPAEPRLDAVADPSRLVGQPHVLLRRQTGRKKVSIILTDWNARESFHAVEYLNRQTAPRDSYEVIWVEFYDRQANPLRRLVAASGRPMLDQWLVLGYPPELMYHKHRAYNAGLVAASGDICVFANSDAMFRPTFVDNLLVAFDETAYAAVHIDMARNLDARFQPFCYPTFEEVIGPGCVNWVGGATYGLWSQEDRLHRADYSACLAARRSDLMSVGGADEHPDYLGASSGPYEMTFRLLNRGRRDRWLTSEYLYQTCRFDPTGRNAEYSGPTDGRDISLRALHGRTTGRVRPYVENPYVGGRQTSDDQLEAFLRFVAEHPEPGWRSDSLPASPPDFPYCVETGFRGHDLYVYRDEWYAAPMGEAFDASRPDALWGEDEESIRLQVTAITPDHPGKPRPGRMERFVRNVMAEPLHCLPRRAWRVAGRAIEKGRRKVGV